MSDRRKIRLWNGPVLEEWIPFFSWRFWVTTVIRKYLLKLSYRPEILAPWLKSNFQTTLFSNFYHFDQPLPSWQPLYNEDEEKAEEMEFFTIPAIIKRRTKYLVQNLNFFIQVQAATKVPSAITKTWRLNDMTAVSVPQHQARVARYEIYILTYLFHLSMQGLGLYCPSQPHLSEPGRKLLSHW